VLGYCPFVREITIVVKPGLTDTDLLCLTNLKNLQLLYIMGHSKSTGDEITSKLFVKLSRQSFNVLSENEIIQMRNDL
jgi:hypothetical protein